MTIALTSPSFPSSLDEALETVRQLMSAAVRSGAEVICFPEAFLPGYRGIDVEVGAYDRDDEERAIEAVSRFARTYGIAVIVGMEHVAKEGRQIVAAVFDREGRFLGHQAKTQLDPSEDGYYVPGRGRRIFEIEGLRFGVVICHEGFRYPETVRWAAVRGARIVFHPHLAGNVHDGIRQEVWGATSGPYYEQAMAMRSRENTIWFASVNYALPFSESATSLIDPDGNCEGFLPHGEDGVLITTIDLDRATGLLASRFAPERF